MMIALNVDDDDGDDDDGDDDDGDDNDDDDGDGDGDVDDGDDDDDDDFSELPNFLFLIHASDMYFLKLWCLFELSNQCLRMVG